MGGADFLARGVNQCDQKYIYALRLTSLNKNSNVNVRDVKKKKKKIKKKKKKRNDDTYMIKSNRNLS